MRNKHIYLILRFLIGWFFRKPRYKTLKALLLELMEAQQNERLLYKGLKAVSDWQYQVVMKQNFNTAYPLEIVTEALTKTHKRHGIHPKTDTTKIC